MLTKFPAFPVILVEVEQEPPPDPPDTFPSPPPVEVIPAKLELFPGVA